MHQLLLTNGYSLEKYDTFLIFDFFLQKPLGALWLHLLLSVQIVVDNAGLLHSLSKEFGEGRAESFDLGNKFFRFSGQELRGGLELALELLSLYC